MTALAADRQTALKSGGDQRTPSPIGAGASAVLYHGGLLARNAAGYGVAATSGGGVVIGITQGKVDNTGGSNGAKDVAFTTGRGVFANGSAGAAIAKTDVGKVCYVVDDQTVGKIGSTPAGIIFEVSDDATKITVYVDPAVTAEVVNNQVNNQTAPSPYLVHTFDVPDAATGDIDIVVDRKIEVIDVVCLKRAGAGAANTMQIKNGANAISNAIACDTDNVVTRAGTIDDAQSVVAAGGTLRLTATRAAGTRTATVVVFCLPRN